MNNNNIIELPFAEPIIRSALDYAYVFGMCIEKNSYRNFLFSCYGNLCLINSERPEDWLLNSWYLDLLPAPRLCELSRLKIFRAEGFELWQKRESGKAELIEFILKTLQQGLYCSYVIDDYYIPGRRFNQRHFPHFCFLIGIDLDKQSVCLVNYFSGEVSDFGKRWVPIDCFVQAFNLDIAKQTNKGDEIYLTWWYKYVEGYRVNVDFDYRFDASVITRQISDYLNSRCSHSDIDHHWNKDILAQRCYFGISVYKHFMPLVRATYNRMGKIDLRNTRLFAEHKSFMICKLRAMEEHCVFALTESCLKEMKAIVRYASEFRLAAFAFQQSRDESIFEEMEKSLTKVREIEERIYPAILRQLT